MLDGHNLYVSRGYRVSVDGEVVLFLDDYVSRTHLFVSPCLPTWRECPLLFDVLTMMYEGEQTVANAHDHQTFYLFPIHSFQLIPSPLLSPPQPG